MRKHILLVTAAILSILSAGCTREDKGQAERKVVITATAPSYSYSADTRTSRDDAGKVYWTPGESIKIFTSVGGGQEFIAQNSSPATSADFVGTISALSGGDEGTYAATIFGLYPFRPDASCDFNNGRITTTLPSIQTARPSAEFATRGTLGDGSFITIAMSPTFRMGFYHVCAGFKFKLNVSGIRQVKFTANNGEYIAGTFNVGFENGIPTAPAITDGSSEITLNPADGETFSTSQYYHITLLPQTLSGGFTITVYDEEDGSGTWNSAENGIPSFTFRRKVVTQKDAAIDVSITDYSGSYAIADISDVTITSEAASSSTFTVKSTKTYGSESTNTGASWVATYSTDGSTWSSDAPDWMSLSAESGSGSTSGETITVNVLSYSEGTSEKLPLAGVDHTSFTHADGSVSDESDVLANQTSSVGTSDAPRDLCLYDILGSRTYTDAENNVHTYEAETANCYVVRAPGYYMFPLVYGNGVKVDSSTSQTENETAYKPGKTSNALPTFYNSNNMAISEPYILGDLGKGISDVEGVVVWQDVAPGFEIIRDSDIHVVSQSSVSGTVNCPYISFSISKARIKSGNVVIALREVSSKKILWSWHIWVSAYPFKNIAVKNRKTDPSECNFLNVPLGWSQPLSFNGSSFIRTCMVKIASANSPETYRTFTVTQKGSDSKVSGGTAYSPTYYQWGRKDPFLGYVYTGSTNKPWTSNHYSEYIVDAKKPTTTVYTQNNTTASIANLIQQPYAFELGTMPAYYNLWDADQEKTGTHDAVVKTIYDPCPRGYSLPPYGAFTGFTSNGSSSGTKYYTSVTAANAPDGMAGYKFPSNKDQSGTRDFFLPVSGLRANGSLNYVASYGLYWSSAPSNGTIGYYLYFSSNALNPVDNYDGRKLGRAVVPVQN